MRAHQSGAPTMIMVAGFSDNRGVFTPLLWTKPAQVYSWAPLGGKLTADDDWSTLFSYFIVRAAFCKRLRTVRGYPKRRACPMQTFAGPRPMRSMSTDKHHRSSSRDRSVCGRGEECTCDTGVNDRTLEAIS